MCVDPVSLTAMGTAAAGALSSTGITAGGLGSGASLAGMAASTGLGFLGAKQQAQGAQLQGTSALLQGQAALFQGQATSDNDMLQSMLALQNAKIEDRNADWTLQAGEQNAGYAGIQNRETMGKLKASQAASGVDVNSGSFVQSRQSVENAGLENQQNIEQQAAQKSYGYRVQGASDRAQAIFDQLSAKEAMIGAQVSEINAQAGAIGANISANSSLLDWGAHAAASWLTPSTSTSTGPDGQKSVQIYTPTSAALGALGTFLSGGDTGGGADMMGEAFANSVY
jgi:hypothetical protein